MVVPTPAPGEPFVLDTSISAETVNELVATITSGRLPCALVAPETLTTVPTIKQASG
jgi:hypothetical protein